ncbi:MAG: C25 family cysteine peptidase [Bacteroidota bacterium]|nr:C25 family cysteine peptidase [Bacteroidota bacterium]
MEITVPQPAFDTDANHALHLRAYHEQRRTGDPLAELVIPIRASKSASVVVVSHVDQSIRLSAALVSPRTRIADHYGIGFAQLRYIGRMRAAPVSRLALGILDQTVPNEIRYTRRVVVRISDPLGLPSSSVTDLAEPFQVSTGVFKQRLSATHPSAPAPSHSIALKGGRILSDTDVKQSPGIQADDGNVYRMYVRKTGIYHIAFEDLKNFGIDPGSVDPNTLRIVNRGQQVPVYVFDHQDGHFDPNDYFEFYGEEKHYDGPGTFGDFYYDPDTKDNVYYLVWGTHYSPVPLGGVKRMVEESGEIREVDRAKFINVRDSAFWSLVHVEQDNIHDDLDISDVDRRSDLRDHDFMAIVGTGQLYRGSYTTQAIVPFADVRQNRPISIRAALHGISHFDPGATDPKGIELPNVDSEDVASISVNNRDVLHGTWDSQTLKFLSTDTASQLSSGQPTAQLLGGPVLDTSGNVSPIGITFSQRRQTTTQGCRFAINWIELGYDRLYYAYQDELAFHAPQHAASALYQFTLQNFSRTDISIYRVGVSKISNVVITSNPDQPRSTKAIFQLNVASDADGFLAVTEAGKLKPTRYVKDDFAGLASPANSGAYLIITNRDHLPKAHSGARVPLQDLADYRASANHVTTKIVDVANIYDEFNYGARSPNAIKAFLSYAYNSWQDPPKYVLLVGVTHQGNDDPKPYKPTDQVPAPYVQAYLEGNVAADAWYAMLDGDDLVPDILLGRLATPDIKGDAAYFAKLKEFEADRVTPGDWKNKALFIGAGGSFDTDIDGIIQRALPGRVSVLRQSTVITSPYRSSDQTLVNNVNNGLAFIGYFGHGGNAIWDDPLDSTGRPVLDNSDLSRFHNSLHYPIILSMTCFTAGYDGPSVGILNTLQNAAGAGTIACMGTTSFGWEQNDEHMAESVVPHLFDSVGGPIAERINAGKIEFLLRADAGDLIPPTLMYCYHFLGDPLAAPHPPSEHVTLTLGSRTIMPGGSVHLSGTTTITSGTASIELVDTKMSPLSPPHLIGGIPVTGGAFSITDNVPAISISHAAYRVTISDNSDARYAATSEDVTITDSRITELDFEPRPLPVGSQLDFSAAIQTPQAIVTVIDSLTIYSQNAAGQIASRTIMLPMTASGDRYHAVVAGNQLKAGDKVVSKVVLTTSSGTVVSDSATIIVGAAVDPSVMKDAYHRTLSGKYLATKNGLAWQERVYNWGASPIGSSTVTLLDERTGSPQIVGSTVVNGLGAHSDALLSIPVPITNVDSALYALAISPDAGGSPLNLRDSLRTNDTTLAMPYAPGAAAYQRSSGIAAHFNSEEIVLSLSPNTEGSINADVIRVNRQYMPAQTVQPDIHFLPLYTSNGRKYAGVRVVSDSLGAIPLVDSNSTLTVRVDSLAGHPIGSLFIYRQDDRSKLWTKLSTTPNGNTLTARLRNLGTFAVAYNTDTKDPVVDMTVEGQIFSQNGEVPPVPHIHAIAQDANGIDLTPGKTILKIDNQLADFVMLDSGRTTTTVNLRLEPSLAEGNHKITIQATDNNGRMNVAKELDVHVSNGFSIGVLGSFPNPFTKEYMFIAYEIRGIAFATSVSLDIYTVSGRRIRTETFPSNDPTRSFGFLKGGTGVPTSLGYHEVWWDGRDDNGDEVANGVYFYRFGAQTPDASRDITGKFARLR